SLSTLALHDALPISLDNRAARASFHLYARPLAHHALPLTLRFATLPLHVAPASVRHLSRPNVVAGLQTRSFSFLGQPGLGIRVAILFTLHLQLPQHDDFTFEGTKRRFRRRWSLRHPYADAR